MSSSPPMSQRSADGDSSWLESFDGTFDGWRRLARAGLAASLAPDSLQWSSTGSSQCEFTLQEPRPARLLLSPANAGSSGVRVPRSFLTLAEEVACHRDDARWALLYRVVWRLTHGEPHVLEVATDRDIDALRSMARSVHHDAHKMRAFVRFREVSTPDGPWFVAWFEPAHHIVEANAPFFRDRFANMRWSILTPDRCVHWDKRELTFTAGVPRETAPPADAMEELWRTYYSSIFNPARLSIETTTAHMPRRYWKNLPEAEAIPGLVAEAGARTGAMVHRSAAVVAALDVFARPPVPATGPLEAVRDAAASCRACPLWRNASCTVFAEGPANARVVLVGEQPGDHEDRQGRPFVGPAGQLLNRALAAAGIERSALYLTNAVKHFKWEPRGKRRLHQRPSAREVAACRPWLEAELQRVGPEIIVCLGATAAQSVVGRAVRVTEERGRLLQTEFGAPALITVHPSALLRLPDSADPAAEFQRFVGDLHGIRHANPATSPSAARSAHA